MNIQNAPKSEMQIFDFKLLFFKLLKSWPWFVLSIIVCLGITHLFLKYSTPIFKISARVLINDEAKGGGLQASSSLGSLGGLISAKSTVDNEAEIFKTRLLMEQVVKSMNLNVTYFQDNTLYQEEIYNVPFVLQVLGPPSSRSTERFKLHFGDNNQVNLSVGKIDTVVNIGSQFTILGKGTFKIINKPNISFRERDYTVVVATVDEKVSQIMSNLTVDVSSKLVSVIDLSLDYPLKDKGEDILAKLIEIYVQENISDRNRVADSTIKFIQNRLSYIGGELGDVESNIEGFKRKNNLADMSEQSKILIQSTSQFSNELSKIETQISILNSLESYLKNESEASRIIPSSLLPADVLFSGLVERYNSLLQEKESQLLSVKPTNPIITNLVNRIGSLRLDMLESLVSTKKGLIISRSQLNARIAEIETEMKTVPKTERDYLQLARTQQIKEELYVFLMQKLEETAISKTSNISNSKLIDPPKSEVTPFSPKKNVLYSLGLFLGILIPTGVILLVDVFNDKIQTKDDIIKITDVPVVGEISHGLDNTIVSSNPRSAISEQFRALRTNLSFYLKDSNQKVILLTSSMSGEGKSFTAINLGNILSLSGKKVVLVELDLRKPGLSVKLGASITNGFTNFVINRTMKASDLLKPSGVNENMLLISSGVIPPNPAELILSSRTKDLIDELKLLFDYVIIDCPPIGILADAQLLSEYADICLYLVRQQVTSKSQINIVENLRVEQKMKQLGIVVNDIKANKGYGYGYGYGENYGVYN